LHEFETLLFSEPNGFIKVFKTTNELQNLFRNFTNPEEINNNPTTAPSKRILKIYPKYQKVTDGIIIAKQIGIKKMMQKCRHFDNWITSMQNV